MVDQVQTPHFIIESKEPDQVQVLESLQQGVLRNPNAYMAGLEICKISLSRTEGAGETAFKQTIKYLRNFPEDTDDLQLAFDQWLIYMQERLDQSFKFDDATEEAIQNSPSIDEINARANKERWLPEKRRDEIRFQRAALFVGRVAAAKELDTDDQSIPSRMTA